MKHADLWRPTKFVNTAHGLRASRDLKQVGIGSRFIGDILAGVYEGCLRAHARGRLLDMGCGYVPLYDIYRNLVQEVTCIDWGNTLHPSIHLDFAVDMNGALPFGDERFDTIVLTDVLEHLAEPLSTVREAARILASGGKLILGVPFFYWIHEAPHDYHRYTEFALRRMCNISNLQVVSIDAYGGLPEIFFDLIAKAIGYLPRLLSSSLGTIHAGVSQLHSMQPLKKISEKSKRTFPLGYVVVAQKPASHNG